MPRSRSRRRWPRRLVLATVVALAAGAGGVAWLYATTPLPDAPPLAQTSLVCPAGGRCSPETAVARFSAGEDRVLVAWDDLPAVLVAAVVAAEDRHFFAHDGIDPAGIARAAVADVRAGARSQGGSTITQQYVKNTYLSPERSWGRKLTEAVLAVKVERELTKQEILTRYLNTIYLGRGTYGVEAAAQAYFGHSVRTVDLGEAALLAGLIRSPESADPALDVHTAAARRDSVLDAMVAVGAVTADEAAAAAAGSLDAPAILPRNPRSGSGVEVAAAGSEHFVEAVRQEVVALVGPAAFTAGLRVHTTLDPAVQAAAVTAVAEALPGVDDPEAAVVVVDDTGAVRALVGGRDFATSEVDLARGAAGGGSGRQAGSLFKPLVVAATLERGGSIDERLPAPATLTLDGWSVSNADGLDHGDVDLVTALARSHNTPFAALGHQLGGPALAEVAVRLGVTGPVPPVASLALGTAEVSPLDMAVVYGTLATGDRVEPHLVTRIETADGELVWSREPASVRALAPDVVEPLRRALRAVVTDGTGAAAATIPDAIGKTGTTQDARDAWFAGAACDASAAVWVGHPDQRPLDAISGSGLPARVWAAVMAAACR